MTTNKLSLKEQIVPFKEFRLNAAKYIALLEKGQSFLIMKRSRPIFRLEPVEEVWETIGDFTTMPNGGVPVKDLIKAMEGKL
jgi:antitoxin (DNA-binding transcriptional repressor) of toxin-antitoxin stability system